LTAPWRAVERLVQSLELALVIAYQKTLSLDRSFWGRKISKRVCRFYPSCSQYTREAIELLGPWKGPWKGLRRIVRCQPFCEGGVDPVVPDPSKQPETGSAQGKRESS